MSSTSTPLPQQQTLRVEFDPSRPSLKVLPASLTVRPGDVVIWQFFGLTREWYPWIRLLQDSLGATGTGPFETVSQSSDAIWGTVRETDGSSTGPKEYGYRASVRILEGLGAEQMYASVNSSLACFRVDGTAAMKTEETPVIVHAGIEGGQLVVAPDDQQISIYGGQSIRWTFPPEIGGSPSDPVLPRVQFLAYQALGTTAEPIDLRLGPFTTMTYDELSVTATGYAQNTPGAYNYRLLAVRESDGEIVWASSPDPLVDDRGEPPPG